MIYLNTHLFFYYPIIPPAIPSAIPRKKNNFFLSTSHSVIRFKKVLYYVTTVYVDNVRKKKYNANGMVLHVVLTKKTDERCHHRRNRRKKIGMNTNLEFNYFVIIILILVCILKSFLFGLHTTCF